VELTVSKLTSVKTQIPYDFYSLPFCKPEHVQVNAENLGESVSGDRNENSVYKLEMKKNKNCEIACAVDMKKADTKAFVRAIDEDYRVHWIVDTMPVGMEVTQTSSREETFERGFPVGFKVGDKNNVKHFLNNHVRIVIEYNDDPLEEEEIEDDRTGKIVGFKVEPASIKHVAIPGSNRLSTCESTDGFGGRGNVDGVAHMSVDRPDTVIFTYDVVWELTEVPWTNRWDAYLTAESVNEKIHWFSITNSMMVVLFLTVMIAMILVRALRKDIAQYNDPASMEEAKEETGWKLVHGDVFRPPQTSPMMLSVFVGTGVQLFNMCLATLLFSVVGLLSPSSRGSIMTGLILLFVFMGSFAGYFSSTTYKMFRGLEWKQNTFMTAFMFPGLAFLILGVINLVLWIEGSSGAVPFSTFFTLLFLWFCVSVPLVFLGSFYGYKREVDPFPVRTNQIPRQIPTSPWFLHSAITCMVGGILPFAAVSVELYFIMSALWLHHIYYIFGFLFLVLLVLVATCAEISILLCYIHLCNEDYHWWWRSFFASGSCAVYIMIYAAWYNITELNLDGFVPVMIYFGYMSLLSVSFFLITGTVGFFSSYYFNTTIYSYLKVD
jgi:transmembrane 9 superfamily member 2/4